MVTGIFSRNVVTRFGAAFALPLLACGGAWAGPLNIRDTPLFLNDSPPPLNMLVMSRDHRLYYEAYNDSSDLDGDGEIDIGYKPTKIDYYGYFESKQCYTYDTGTGRFNPAGATGPDKTCTAQWSGDWLNYVTMSRIDALRKVLYGGLRSSDTNATTVLQRAYIPQDAHSWGKEYSGLSDGYDISKYTPFALPATGKRHLFANTTLNGDGNVNAPTTNPAIVGVPLPKMRVLLDSDVRVWNWLSIERPVAGGQVVTGTNAGGGEIRSNVTPTDYIVRVRVCSAGSYDPDNTNCKTYASGGAKPTGLLQDYGENDAMYFGLLSGSYGKPHEGGVLRKEVASMRSEIDLATGRFIYNQNPNGIIATIDRLRITGVNRGAFEYNCGWITNSSDVNGNCSMWGNPTAEMMYEALRYFAGKTGSTDTFSSGANSGEETGIGLTMAPWNASTNPYRSSGGFASCSKPFETVISDISPSYDSDTIPGSAFNTGYTGDLTGMDATTLGKKIWDKEMGGAGRFFIGQSAGVYDGAPTAKDVTSFADIRGLAPEAPAKEGSYNAASVAYFGHQNDINAAAGVQKVQTFAVALASPLPKIEIKVAGKVITLVPFAKSVDGSGIDRAQNRYQPTNQIVDFYVDTITPTSGKFRVNFEDVEQGADHDMDAIVVYEYAVNSDDTVTVTLTSEYAAGGIVQHMGYVVSGSTEDGTYLVVRDRDTCDGCDRDYFLDTPNVAGALPLTSTLTFKPGTTTTAGFLKDPLWYAAKWGGFTDSNNDGMPDIRSEWANDAPATNLDPNPDNYFLVTNALKLKDQLSQAFNAILDRAGSASSASVSSGSISEDTRVYQATFDARNWSGHLIAYSVGTGQDATTEGALGDVKWDAVAVMPAPADRNILTVLPTVAGGTTGVLRTGVAFKWSDIQSTRQAQLQPTSDGLGERRLDFLRGDRSNEAPAGVLRKRTAVLGDIVNSAPVFVGAPPWRYPDTLEPGNPYSTFVTAQTDRQKVVYAGANDGMMHAFNAETGQELFAYIPHGVFRNLYRLADTNYSHLFYADGTPSVVDAFLSSDNKWHTVLVAGLNKGGQSIYALDVTNPAAITEASASTSVLWEFTDKEDADLGYTYSRPAVVKLQNGQWVAIFGNGYNNTENVGGSDTSISTTGNAALYIVDVATGVLQQKITLPAGMSADPTGQSRPNGLSTPAVIDQNGDGKYDTAYAGDLFGNLWKFDLSGAKGSWAVAYQSAGVPQPLFVARNASNQRQPITERPQVGRGPNGRGWLILFGTGKFLEPDDRNLVNLKVQSFYGIFDRATGAIGDIVARSELLQQTVVTELAYTWTDSGGVVHTGPQVRVTSNNARGPTHRGWYIDLVAPTGFEGEMQVTNPVLRNGRVIFTTLIPDSDLCKYGGRSWFMDIDALSGSRLAYTPFDLNRDKEYNSTDFVLIDGVRIPVSGRGSSSILTAPAFLSGTQGDYAATTSSGSDTDDDTINIDRSNAGPSGRGRQSWRQLR